MVKSEKSSSSKEKESKSKENESKSQEKETRSQEKESKDKESNLKNNSIFKRDSTSCSVFSTNDMSRHPANVEKGAKILLKLKYKDLMREVIACTYNACGSSVLETKKLKGYVKSYRIKDNLVPDENSVSISKKDLSDCRCRVSFQYDVSTEKLRDMVKDFYKTDPFTHKSFLDHAKIEKTNAFLTRHLMAVNIDVQRSDNAWCRFASIKVEDGKLEKAYYDRKHIREEESEEEVHKAHGWRRLFHCR